MSSFHRRFRVFLVGALACLPTLLTAQATSLPQQIADVMVQINGGIHTGFRFAHAKGLVLTGTFTPARGATAISRAVHLRGGAVPITVRLSDSTGVPQINDDNPTPPRTAWRSGLRSPAGPLPTSWPTRTTASSSAPVKTS